MKRSVPIDRRWPDETTGAVGLYHTTLLLLNGTRKHSESAYLSQPTLSGVMWLFALASVIFVFRCFLEQRPLFDTTELTVGNIL